VWRTTLGWENLSKENPGKENPGKENPGKGNPGKENKRPKPKFLRLGPVAAFDDRPALAQGPVMHEHHLL
jgi:hypothetical protein